MINYYTKLRDRAQAQHNWSTEHLSYHAIVIALSSDDPKSALDACIAKAKQSITEHDKRICNIRDGYRAYYHRKIELFEQVLNDLYARERGEIATSVYIIRFAESGWLIRADKADGKAVEAGNLHAESDARALAVSYCEKYELPSYRYEDETKPDPVTRNATKTIVEVE